MSYDPEVEAAKAAGKMEQLTGRIQAHYATILDAWSTGDPDTTLPGAGYDRPRGSGRSDPTASAEVGAQVRRIKLLQAVARTTLQLGELVRDLGHDTDAAVEHVEWLAYVDVANAPYPANGSMRSLLAIHRGWWQTLHDTVMWYASSAEGAAEAASIVDYITERREHQLEHQLKRVAGRCRLLIVQPDHPRATRRQRCDDPLGRGCTRPLSVEDAERNRAGCGACRKAKSRQESNA